MRFAFACLIFVAASGAAWAQTANAPQTPDALNAVYACAQQPDDAARLACYDAAVGRLRQAQTEGEVVAVDRVQAEELTRESFGLPVPNLSRILSQRFGQDAEAAAEADREMTFQVASIEERRNGRHAFTMTNGQVWVQVEGVRARHVRVGQTVVIRRAAAGSFLLDAERGASLRVRREE